MHPNVAHGFERAPSQNHGRAGLQVQGTGHDIQVGADVCAVRTQQVGVGSQSQGCACAQAHRTRSRYIGDRGRGHGQVAVGGRQGLHRDHAAGDGGVAGVAQLGFEQGQPATSSRFYQTNVAAAGIAQAGGVDFGGKQVDAGDCIHQQGCALQGLAALAVAQAGVGFIALRDLACGRVQGDVLQGAGLAQVGRRQQAVADVDVAGGIQLDSALDGQAGVGRTGDVFNGDGVAVHLQRGLKGVLVGTREAGDAHRTLARRGVAVAVHMAQNDF